MVGTPVLVTASGDLSDSHELVERAETGKRVVSLTHALADERDAQVRQLAAKGSGQSSQPGPGAGEGDASDGPADTKALQAQVDSRLSEVRSQLPGEVRELLDGLPEQRREVRSSRGNARAVLAVHNTYTDAIQALGTLTEETARSLPPRATADRGDEPAAAYALPYLGRLTEQASASRGLLSGALAGGGPQPELTTAAAQARVREQAAHADFEQTAHEDTRERLRTTVTGSEVTTAERYLDRMTAARQLTRSAQRFSQDRVDTNLTARVDRIRSVHSSLANAEVERIEALRDNDVTALQLRFVLVGAALLLAIGAGIWSSRSMTRPLAALRIGSGRIATDPAHESPVKFTGRNDEYAEVVRSVNQIHAAGVQLRERAESAEADAVRQAAGRKKLAAERDALREEVADLSGRLSALDGAVHGTFVQLALRNLGLTERQLSQLEALEEQEQEPDQLATLFKLDHLATRMRRHGENLLLLAGAEHSTSHHQGPAPLLDVLRAAISEIERYERVALATLPPHAQVAGFAADDISHLVAELLDNATAFSPPDAEVQLSGWMLENGEIMLSVADTGIGMTSERLAELNERLGAPERQDPPSADGDDSMGIGLYVVARLAARHGMRVQLRVQKQGGVTAVVVLPKALLPDRPNPARLGSTTAGAGTTPSLPGTVAESNSHVLPGRRVPQLGSSSTETATDADAETDAKDAETDAKDAETDATDAETGTDFSVGRDAFTEAVQRAERRAEAQSAVGDEAAPESRETSEDPSPGGSPAAGTDKPATESESDSEPETATGQEPESGPSHLAPSAGADTPETADDTGDGTDHAADDAADATDASRVADAAAAERRLTDKGLPKRTPNISPVSPSPAAVPAPRVGGARADELRRRIGGFRQGAQHGERDAAAQLAAEHSEGTTNSEDGTKSEKSEKTESSENASGSGSATGDSTSTTGTTSTTTDQQDQAGADEMGETAEEARQ